MNQQLHVDPGSPRILIAEDSPTQAAQIIQFLTQRGYAVQAARNGEEAYDLALRQRPDILISDIVMPGIDGYELCRRLKSTPGHEDTPVILVTSLSQPQDVLAGLEAGADNFIIKPYNEDILSARINYLLMNKSLRRSERAGERLEVEFGGERHQITARKQQILDLLISTYAQAVHLFSALDQGRQELSQSYEALQALYEMSNGLNRCRTPADVAAIAVSRCVGMPGVRSAWLYLRQEDSLALAAERHVARSAQIDPYDPTRAGDAPFMAPADEAGHVVLRANGGGGIRHHASLKLQVGPQIMGYLNIVGTEPTVGGEMAPQTLGAIASQLSIALERAMLHTGLEVEVRRRTQLLTEEIEERRQATETITAIFNASPVALVSLDSQLNIAGWNRTATEVFRTTPEAIAGQRWSSLFVSEPVALDRALSALRRGAEVASIEVDARLHDNTPRSLHVAGEPLIDGGGIFRGAVLAIDDITDVKQVKERLHQAQKMEAVGNLTGGIAHDFNNLLTTIIGNLDLAMLKASADQRSSLDTALRASLRGSELTKKLLAFARKQSLEPQVIDPVEIVEEVGLLLAGRMASRITMSISAAPGIPHIYADPTELETALINLAINARDAMPEGGELNIAATYVPPDPLSGARSFVEFCVSDTGVGIPAEKLDRIFEPFFTTKEPGKGTGLGLAMVYGFASQSGGYLTVDSEVDVGTVFRLGLPAVSETAARALPDEESPDASATEPLRVLLIEHDCEVCRLVEAALGRAGHEVLVAGNEERLRAHLDATPRLDLLMVEVEPDGQARLALIRTMLATGACRRALVISTSRSEAEAMAQALDGCAILIKPFRVQELNDAIATLF